MCTDTAAMGQGGDGFASWKFKGTMPHVPVSSNVSSDATLFIGSAITITSLLTSFSSLYTITIDGNGTTVDGARPSTRAFDCFTLFSTAGLDPNVEHTVNLTVKGVSPNANTTLGGGGLVFSLVNYT